jgi:UDP-N-acetyl-D-mannosaminuronic acid dehydrogenase
MKKICIIGGAGHIGLPLALKFCEKNFHVDVIDKNKLAIKDLKNSIFPFHENGGQKLLNYCLKNKKLNFYQSYEQVKKADFIIITVGTPLVKKKPSLKQIFEVILTIKKYLKNNQSIILRSTVFPGAMHKIYNKIRIINKTIGISYCPERVAQGQSLEEIKKLNQIIASSNKKEEVKIKKLFKNICDDTSVCSFGEAELIKLFSNAWRYVKFAISNEFYMLSDDQNLNYKKIHHLMTKDYPRNAGLPTQGFAAGPCLPKDAVQLYLSNKQKSKLIRNSYNINENLPNYFANKLKKKINISGKNIGILGTTFKSNIDDERDSLSMKLKGILEKNGAKVFCNDPNVKKKNYLSINKIKQKCKIIFLSTPHKQYKKINLKNKLVIDCWDYLKN